MPVNLPTNLLRSFVAIVDNGSMLSAAGRVFVTQSALSLQIRRLEEMVQKPLFKREGRRLSLTPAGDVLLDYARRVLSLHDEAIVAVSTGQSAAPPVRIGMVQDFADALLAGVLTRFAELHPASQIYTRVAGTAELLDLLERQRLDLIVGFASSDDPAGLRKAPMAWYGAFELADEDVVPLAVLERPCRFREAAVASLEASGRAYRITVETPNLSTLRAAVQARLGLTCRTPLFFPDLPLATAALPPLPEVTCLLATGTDPSVTTTRLATLMADVLRQL